MFVLITRKRDSYRVFGVLISVLFVIATIGVVFQHAIEVRKAEQYLVWYTIILPPFANVPSREVLMPSEGSSENAVFLRKLYDLLSSPGDAWSRTYNSLTFGLQILTLLGNCVTDVLLLSRCFLLWGRDFRYIIIPGLFCLGVNIYAFDTFVNFPFAVCAALSNVFLTMMIAGRIIYISRQVSRYLPSGGSFQRTYRTAVSATLESGMIYPLILIMHASTGVGSHVIDGSVGSANTGLERLTVELLAESTYHALLPIMGISSTIVIVRATLGLAIHDEKSCIETFTAARPVHETSVVDIRQHCHEVESTDTEAQRPR
ncbi:hypothetical protein PM082_011360 [Marasmius tenuissimus]|nr:hypothetical protein PM082_011360 [Marasmius tenuissimus]